MGGEQEVEHYIGTMEEKIKRLEGELKHAIRSFEPVDKACDEYEESPSFSGKCIRCAWAPEDHSLEACYHVARQEGGE